MIGSRSCRYTATILFCLIQATGHRGAVQVILVRWVYSHGNLPHDGCGGHDRPLCGARCAHCLLCPAPFASSGLVQHSRRSMTCTDIFTDNCIDPAVQSQQHSFWNVPTPHPPPLVPPKQGTCLADVCVCSQYSTSGVYELSSLYVGVSEVLGTASSLTPTVCCAPQCSYKRVKGRSHTAEKRISMHPHKPHATSQPSRLTQC